MFTILICMAWGQSIICQSVEITITPEWGSGQNLSGRVHNVDSLDDYGILAYVFVEEAGGWWTKPTFTQAISPIYSDSTFYIDVCTGGLDAYSTRIICFLFPKSNYPPLLSGSLLPLYLFNYPYDVVNKLHGDRKIEWSDWPWVVKRSVGTLMIGPGMNLFGSDSNHVYVNNNDELVLSIRQIDSKWWCSEVILDSALGYGTYSCTFNTDPNLHDEGVVWGFFHWDDIGPYAGSENPYNKYFNEVDIERWIRPEIPSNFQYVIQPWDTSSNIEYFMEDQTVSTHRFQWTKESILFESLTSDSTLTHSWNWSGDTIPAPIGNIRFNVWLKSYNLSDDQECKVQNFYFEYPLDAPINVNASDGEYDLSVSWEASSSVLYYGIYRDTINDQKDAHLLNNEWISQTHYTDTSAIPGVTYYYWVRCSDNLLGSNTKGYASGFSDSDSGYISLGTGYQQMIPGKEFFKVFPNPFKEGLFIHSIMHGHYSLKIYNTIGQLLFSKEISDKEYYWSPPTELHPGVYFIQIICSGKPQLYKCIFIN